MKKLRARGGNQDVYQPKIRNCNHFIASILKKKPMYLHNTYSRAQELFYKLFCKITNKITLEHDCM